MKVKFGEKPTKPMPTSGGPWVWINGEWLEMVTDTGDGVPKSLDLEKRFNKAHDKAGKFASKSGGGGLGGIAKRGKPTVVSREEFDQKFPDSDTHLYRGTKSPAGAARARDGVLGGGDYGQGQYFGDGIGTAQSYMQEFMGDTNGVMVRAAIDRSKSPKIATIPAKVRAKGPTAIDTWATQNEIDIVDADNYQIVRNPAALVMDSHNYTLEETVVLNLLNKGYTIPDKYKQAAETLNSRYNKAHDKAGKFASKSGTGFGEFTKEDIQYVDMGAQGYVPGRRWSTKNGAQITVLNREFSDELVEKVIIPHVTKLHNDNPIHGPLRLQIEHRTFMGGKEVTGSATVDGIHMKLNGELLKDNHPIDSGNFNARAAQGKSSIEYALTHEWGHLIDRDSGKTGALFEGGMKAPSDYGKTSKYEGFAENFAEFYLSGGTTAFLAPREFAKEFKWNPPSTT